jgi:hypothetical protein
MLSKKNINLAALDDKAIDMLVTAIRILRPQADFHVFDILPGLLQDGTITKEQYNRIKLGLIAEEIDDLLTIWI